MEEEPRRQRLVAGGHQFAARRGRRWNWQPGACASRDRPRPRHCRRERQADLLGREKAVERGRIARALGIGGMGAGSVAQRLVSAAAPVAGAGKADRRRSPPWRSGRNAAERSSRRRVSSARYSPRAIRGRHSRRRASGDARPPSCRRAPDRPRASPSAPAGAASRPIARDRPKPRHWPNVPAATHPHCRRDPCGCASGSGHSASPPEFTAFSGSAAMSVSMPFSSA